MLARHGRRQPLRSTCVALRHLESSAELAEDQRQPAYRFAIDADVKPWQPPDQASNFEPDTIRHDERVVLTAVAAAGDPRAGTEPVSPGKFHGDHRLRDTRAAFSCESTCAPGPTKRRAALSWPRSRKSPACRGARELPTVATFGRAAARSVTREVPPSSSSTSQGETVTFVTDKLIGGYEFKVVRPSLPVRRHPRHAQARLHRDRAATGRQRARRRTLLSLAAT